MSAGAVVERAWSATVTRPTLERRVMSDARDALRTALPSAVLGGVVWLFLAFATGSEPNFLQGALFVLAFGVVSAIGYHYSQGG